MGEMSNSQYYRRLSPLQKLTKANLRPVQGDQSFLMNEEDNRLKQIRELKGKSDKYILKPI